MNISPVSFGKKIPVAACRIKDNTNGNSFPAVLYELDCNDKEDIYTVRKQCGYWKYGKDTVNAMQTKYNSLKRDSLFYGKSKSFYILQKNNDEIVGISRIDKTGQDIKLDIIETSPEQKYKYVGQSIIALIGEMALDEGKNGIYIPVPIESAKKFYSDKCGFKNSKTSDAMYLSPKGINKLKKRIGQLIGMLYLKNNTSNGNMAG